jgi:hypothetical protein
MRTLLFDTMGEVSSSDEKCVSHRWRRDLRGDMHNHTIFIGERDVWGGKQQVGLHHADRRHHLYTIGKTGVGKTTLIRNMALADIRAGHGVGVIDPHGDLAEDLLDYIPRNRIDDVIYFNPADRDYPIGLNLFRDSLPRRPKHLVASGIVGIFKSIWKDSWGPRLEYILYAAAAALLECPNVSLLGIQRILVDPRYRARIVKQIKDPVVRSFWLNEFENYDKKFLQEAIAPIQNKVGQLLMAPPIRNVLGQVGSKINPRSIMDDRKIFIANLSKGKLGEDKSRLLGAVLVTEFQLAAMSRASVPEHERVDFYLTIDECHNFMTDTFASILSESRKMRLCLTLSHQYTGQLHDEIRDAVFGNVGTMISFRVGESDAEVLSRAFDQVYPARRFTELSNYEAIVKGLEHGEQREPFFTKTFAPIGRRYGRRKTIIEQSRIKYANRRVDVEDKIARWMEN